MRFQSRGASQAPTVIDPRRRVPIDVQAQLDGLADGVLAQVTGSRHHYRVTVQHTVEIGDLRDRHRWVVVGLCCASLLALAGVSGASFALAWLILGGAS